MLFIAYVVYIVLAPDSLQKLFKPSLNSCHSSSSRHLNVFQRAEIALDCVAHLFAIICRHDQLKTFLSNKILFTAFSPGSTELQVDKSQVSVLKPSRNVFSVYSRPQTFDEKFWDEKKYIK